LVSGLYDYLAIYMRPIC